MTNKPLTFTLSGTGAFLPERKVASRELDALFAKEAGWTSGRFGIEERYWASEAETSSHMAEQACRGAIAQAGWDAGDIDAIIGACGVMEQPIPSTAALVQRRLGLGDSGIPAFDINATCLSFLVALERAVIGLAIGQWKRVLIFSSDIASAALDYTDPEASAIFGDGAAACVVEAGSDHTLRGFKLETFADGAEYCQLAAGGTRVTPHKDMERFWAGSRFAMDGPALSRFTARKFPEFLDRVLTHAAVTRDQVNTVIPHQASAHALGFLKRVLRAPGAKVFDRFAEYGNQIAASVPHMLHHARMSGALNKGSTSLLIGSSAGVSLGGAVIQW